MTTGKEFTRHHGTFGDKALAGGREHIERAPYTDPAEQRTAVHVILRRSNDIDPETRLIALEALGLMSIALDMRNKGEIQ